VNDSEYLSQPVPAFDFDLVGYWTPALHAAGLEPAPIPASRGSFFGLQSPAGATGLQTDPAHHTTLMAHNRVMVRLWAANAPDSIVPADTLVEERRRKFHNGQLIELFYEPNAITDADSIVHVRRSDVIATGDVFTTTQYPFYATNTEVLEYRDMVVIVRDRMQAMIKTGATLDQIKAARVTADYDARYGANSAPWTNAMFIDAVYNSLKK
jgi:hypothetical protein